MRRNAPISLGRPRQFDRDTALRVALELFSRHGYEGVSISDLTQAIGIVPTSLYAAFGNKEKLYREALGLFLNRQSRHQLKQDVPIRVGIYELMFEAVRDAVNPDHSGCMVATGMLTCGAEHSALADTVAKVRVKNLERIVAGLVHAKGRGELSAETNPRALGRYIMAIMQGIAVQAHDGATYEELMRIVNITVQSLPLS